MRRHPSARAIPIAAALALIAVSACQSERAAAENGIRFELIAEGLRRPVHLDAPAGDSRIFVVEQVGLVRIIEDGQLVERPFLDLTRKVRTGFERGLLSIAFHPDYQSNGWCFVNYTDRDGDTRIERYTVSDVPDVADAGSAKLILAIEQPYGNHNGGHLRFGPDGFLYIGMGDGGAANDPRGYAQDLGSRLGKMLRIDVDRGDPYAVPPDNPFVGRGGVQPEIWALGLRNPWRFHFDPVDDLLYIADVGQNQWEEINVTPAARAGLDFGWNIREGAHCFRTNDCDTTGLTDPVVEYEQPDGCSVTGGLVYRGTAIAELEGHYVYGDYCKGWIRSFRYRDGQVTERREWAAPRGLRLTSFGSDGHGELYVLDENGRVFRFAPNE